MRGGTGELGNSERVMGRESNRGKYNDGRTGELGNREEE